MLTAKEQKLLDALEPTAAASGVEIVTLEIMGSKKAPTIRVFIDTEEGVSFDELASAQVWINRIMDEIDPFPGAYMLEVSSPGTSTARCENQLSGAAPCQCLTSGGMFTTSPGTSSCAGLPAS